ncbi:MAG: preprotein translocase subunit SecY [Oscillospiraceae bacterium]
MITTIRNAWKIPELRKKLMFTLLILFIYRIGNRIPVPYVDVEALRTFFDQRPCPIRSLGFYNTSSGSAFSEATILALSIQPYINASIIIQLLTIAIPALERMAKEEGEVGKKKLERITRYTTVGLGLLMGVAYTIAALNNYNIPSADANFLSYAVIVLAFTAGSALVMWLGEQITEFGIGNGISMILFANIISRIPDNVISLVTNLSSGAMKRWGATINPGGRGRSGAADCLHQRRRAPDSHPVRQAGGGPEGLWRPETPTPSAHYR